MARDHARVFTRIWGDPDWRKLSGAAQRAYVLVLTDPSLTYCGTTATTVKRWSQQASDTPERLLRKAFEELSDGRFLVFDWDTEEVLVRTYMRSDKVLTVPNVAKAAYSAYRSVLSPRIKAELLVELHRTCKAHPDSWREGAIAGVEPWLTEPLPEGLTQPLPEELLQWLPEGLR